jgi:Ca2+-binding EF-hand superfamily protein
VVLLLPLLPAKDRRGVAVRLCEAGLQHSACRLLVRSMLLLDRNRDGNISVDELQRAFLSCAAGLVVPEVAMLTLEHLSLMVAADDKYDGYANFSDIFDQLIEEFPQPNVLEMTTVNLSFPVPFKPGRDDALLERLRKGLMLVPNDAVMQKEDLEEFLRKETGTGELHTPCPEWITTIITLFSRISLNPKTCCIAAGALARASEVFFDGISVGVNALPPQFTARAIAVALPAPQQRDLAVAFLLADASRDGVLDFAEFSPVLSKLIRRPLKDALVFRNFAAIDVDKDGYLELDEFLTAFANRKLNVQNTVGAILAHAEERKRTNNATIAAKEGVTVPQPPTKASPKKSHNSPFRHTAHNAIPVAVCDDDLSEEFCKIDTERTGLISRSTFATVYAALEHYGLPPSRDEIERLMNRFCLAKPGFVTYEEFCVIMLRRSRM